MLGEGKMNPLISIIVPVYKVQKYLEKCINSILAQSINNFELILIDDGSPDDCGIICDSYAAKDKRVKVIHKKNEGLSAARNTGLEIAEGKYIGFIDSDDWVDQKMYETLINLLIDNDADIAQCEFIRIFDEDEKVDNSENNNIQIFNNIESLKNIYNEKSISTVVSWNKLYKKELFQYIRFPKGKIHEDEFTTHKLLYTSRKLVYTDKIFYYYRQTPNSIMNSKFNKKRLDILDAMEERLEFAKLIEDEIFINETLKKYMFRLINFYYKCKEEIPEEKDIIRDIKDRSHKLYFKYYMKSNLRIRSKLKYGLFSLFPDLYIYRDIHKKK
jgi:glycosyltransferase involved in cell wall biosynthesis